MGSLRDTEAGLGAGVWGYPHPGCFGKRGCKLLKTKDGTHKKSIKRLQTIEGTRVKAGGVCEVCSRQHA